MLLASLFVLLLLLIALGMEIAWAIGVASFLYLVLSGMVGGSVPLQMMPMQILDGVDSFALISIPLFLFAGNLMTATGVTERLVRFALAFMGHIKGGLANVAIATNFVLSGVSGSAIADAAATAKILVPQMARRGYSREFSCAVISAAATVVPIVPPSIIFVLLASIVNISVGRLFIAGILPGVVITGALLILTYFIARRRNLPVEARADWRERGRALLEAALPLLAPILILRAISAGIATPTEAAALLAFYILVLGGLIYRTLTLRAILTAASDAMVVSAVVLVTAGTANLFSWIAIYEDFGVLLTRTMQAISTEVWVQLLVLNLLLLVLGTFMEALPVILLLGPLVFPMFIAMGVDPIHLGVVVTVNLVLGMITPPVGLIVNVAALAGGASVSGVFRALTPFFVVLVGVLLVITYVPAISLWLPDLLMTR